MKKQKIFYIIYLLIYFFSSNKTYAADRPKELHFAFIGNLPNQIIGSKILETVYSKLNIPVTINNIPGLRSTKEIIHGQLDGEIQRNFQYGIDHPELIRIEPSINYSYPNVFSKNKNLKVNSWNDIFQYRVAVIKGTSFIKDKLSKFKKIEQVNSIEQLVMMLEYGRIDIFITDKINATVTINRMKLNKKINSIPIPSGGKTQLYHYLNIKHQNLAPQLQDVIKKMKKDGELETLQKKYYQEFFTNLNDN